MRPAIYRFIGLPRMSSGWRSAGNGERIHVRFLRLRYFAKSLVIASACVCLWMPGARGQRPAEAQKLEDPVAAARVKLAVAEAAHPGNTVEVVEALITLAQKQTIMRQTTDETMTISQRAVAMSEAATGKESIAYASALAGLGKVYFALDHPEKGRPLAEEGLEIARRMAPGTLSLAEVADALNKICFALSDLPCSLRAEEMAVEAVRASKTENELYLASMLQDLAQTRITLGDMAGTRVAMEESVAIVERQPKPTEAMTVLENNAGAYFLRTGHVDEALVHLNKSLAMSTEIFGPESVQIGYAEGNLGDMFARAGNYEDSWKHYERSLVLHRRWYGPTNSRTAYLESDYSAVLAAGGRSKEAIEVGLRAHQSVREFITLAIRVLPERQALTLTQKGAISLDVPVSLVARDARLAAADVYQEVIRSRALVADEMAHRQADLNRKNDPEVLPLLKELEQQRTRLFALRGSSSAAATSSKQVDEATERMERTERALAERSLVFRSDQRIRTVALEDVRRHLPANSVLVSYVGFKRLTLKVAKGGSGTTPSYVAFVLHPDSGVIRVFDLGDSKGIEELVTRVRAAADAESVGGGLGSKRNERRYRESAEALRKLIWDPLRGEMGSAKLVLVVPDGVLNLIPFSALPEGTGYLVEHGPVVHVLSSERDLVPAESTQKKTGLLVIGSPTFETAAVGGGGTEAVRGNSACGDFRSVRFNALPGAGEEATDIATSWKKWRRNERSELVTGSRATRELFVEQAARFRVLHVATHAFLLDRKCGNGNPLLNSGLVFAGTKEHRDASILTAQQIASLDLGGVDWAVLSACSTGTGELRDGEGVLGLQRAFRVAGARSVVMTLWPVDDGVTQQFMHELYAQRLGRHASTADAVWSAARNVLLQRRAAGKSTNPWYWAGFVGSGGWE